MGGGGGSVGEERGRRGEGEGVWEREGGRVSHSHTPTLPLDSRPRLG